MTNPRANATDITVPDCFMRVEKFGQTILLNSPLSALKKLFFFVAVASLIAFTSFALSASTRSYFVSLWIVCFLQNLQYFLVSMRSG
jgi:hypothetical protein